MTVIDADSCMRAYAARGVKYDVTPDSLCAGTPHTVSYTAGGSAVNRTTYTADACDGDSGSPLFLNGTQVGVVSRGWSGCGVEPVPSLYAGVASNADWIVYASSPSGAPMEAWTSSFHDHTFSSRAVLLMTLLPLSIALLAVAVYVVARRQAGVTRRLR